MLGPTRVVPTGDAQPARDPVEMTGDPPFARRVARLALTSIVALGVIWLLATTTLSVVPPISLGLLGGWLLMPSLLGLSLRWSRIRYAVVVPAALVSLALLAICRGSLPEDPLARAGWLLITAGVLFGGLLGGWFWFRLLPVPRRLHFPFSFGRWILIGVHVSAIVLGLILASLAVLLRGR